MSFFARIVKNYIRKLIIHQAKMYNHNPDEIDIIARIYQGDVTLFTYSLKFRETLNILTDDETERILKG